MRRRGELKNGVEVQFWDNGVLKFIEAKPRATARGNLKVEAFGKILVFESLMKECDVVTLESGKWVKVGRVTRYKEIILGSGMSSMEIEHFKSSRERRDIKLCKECAKDFEIEAVMIKGSIRMLDASLMTTGFLTEKCDVCGREAPVTEYVGARVKQITPLIPKW